MLLNDGELAGLDPITPTPRVRLPFETATRIALADVEHLTELIEHGHDVRAECSRQLAAELETLCDLAVLRACEAKRRPGRLAGAACFRSVDTASIRLPIMAQVAPQ
jgi:hypothetical protein